MHMQTTAVVFYGLIFASLFCTSFFLLQAVTYRQRRWRSYHFRYLMKHKQTMGKLEKLILKCYPKTKLEQYRQWLSVSGIHIPVSVYLLIKRLCLWGGLVALILHYWFLRTLVSVMAASILLVILLFILDSWMMKKISKQRREAIAQEIFLVSYHLLYYQGSKLNIHTKLNRCLPYTKRIRKDLQLLLNEWYGHAGQALKNFQERLGTEEAHSFAETIDRLRDKDDSTYYHLLRQRVADYKQKVALLQESKNETNAYVLFVLAGIPLLNTFRVFIYPWVEEGMRLFKTLY